MHSVHGIIHLYLIVCFALKITESEACFKLDTMVGLTSYLQFVNSWLEPRLRALPGLRTRSFVIEIMAGVVQITI